MLTKGRENRLWTIISVFFIVFIVFKIHSQGQIYTKYKNALFLCGVCSVSDRAELNFFLKYIYRLTSLMKQAKPNV